MREVIIIECFIISPIGGEESKIREHANDVLNYIIKPVTYKYRYDIIRADKIEKPGMITS